MRTRILGLAIVLLMIAGGASCKKKSSTPTSPTGPGNSNSVTITIPVSDVYGVSTFAPGTVNVVPGTIVTWSNRDNIAHTTTSNTNVWSNGLDPNGSFTRTFDARGSFPYHCTVHPGMTGTINVQ